MPANNLLLFVYGTLRRGCPSGAHRQYLQGAQFIGAAKTRGQLFLIDYYPGFCPAPGPDNTLDSAEKPQNTGRDCWVWGEVYLLESEAQLRQLDSYEGCASDSPAPQEYTRGLIAVTLASGAAVTVWAYIYNGDPSLFGPIESGDFLRP